MNAYQCLALSFTPEEYAKSIHLGEYSMCVPVIQLDHISLGSVLPTPFDQDNEMGVFLEFFIELPITTHGKIDLPRVGHDREAMINSPEVIEFLSEVFN